MSERALLLESINPAARDVFLAAGYEVDEFPKSVTHEELALFAKEAIVLGVRSGPEVGEEVIEQADRLEAIGCFCVGTSHVALEAAADCGVPVFNAAHENTRSVAEHVIGGVFSLLKRTGEHNLSLHSGTWSKTEEKTFEVKGKTIGIVGYGAIGSQVSVLAEAVGMTVIYFDPNPQFPPYGTARRVETLEDLLSQTDVTTLHVPGGERTRRLINADSIRAMKDGSYLINTARGEVVDYDAVIEALETGKLAGVAVDVYEDEPTKAGNEFLHPLQQRSDALLTPHTAGSTKEAQAEIGQAVAQKLIGYIATGTTIGAVNLPEIAPGPIQGDLRIISIHDNKPSVIAEINEAIAGRGYNIVNQQLKTMGDRGIVAIDLEGVGDDYDGLSSDLAHMKHIRVNRFLEP